MKLNGTQLINARHRMGLNQELVAKACDVSTVTISNAENEKEIHPATGKKICEFLGIDLAYAVLPIEENANDVA